MKIAAPGSSPEGRILLRKYCTTYSTTSNIDLMNPETHSKYGTLHHSPNT